MPRNTSGFKRVRVNMRSIVFFIFISLFSGGVSMAQMEHPGELRVYQDPKVDTLMHRYQQVNEMHQLIDGWRIEIFFEAGNLSKKLAMEAKSEFVKNYPEVPSYLIFQQPYYKVRVGDFRTKMEAERFLNEIGFAYPQAFVVMDEINFPILN
jgi:hypothetical protein